MKKFFVCCIVLCVIVSCKKRDKQEGTIIDTDIVLSIESPSGVDLLNPSSLNPIIAEDIQMYYESDGRRETYASQSNGYQLDNPSGFTLGTASNSDGKYYLHIFSNCYVSDHSITVLTIKGSEDIKLVTEVVQTDGGIRIRKVWHKGVLVWPYEGVMGRVVHIVLDH